MKMKTKEFEITVSNRTVIRVLLIILATFMFIRILDNISHALQLIFIAAFLSLAFNPAVSWLVRRLRLKSRIAGTAVAYILVVAVVIFFSVLVIAPLVRQSIDFVREAPRTVSNLKSDTDSALGKFIQKNQLHDEIDSLSDNIRYRTRNLEQPVVNTASRVGSVLISTLTVLVLTFMMLIEGPFWIQKYLSFQTESRRKHQKEIGYKMYQVVIGYVNGQLLLALISSLLSLVALLIASNLLNVSINAVALAGIVFVCGLIPMIGHIIGGVIVCLACLFVSFPLAIIMGIYIFAYQQIENVTLQPYIQAKYNELTPLLVFVAALVGISIAGILGGFVAIPVAGCLRILVQDYLSRRTATTGT